MSHTVEIRLKEFVNKGKARILNNGVSAYWWKGIKNFGDLITPELIQSFGYTSIWEPIGKTNLIGVGSILQQLPTNYSGIIIGSGLIDNRSFSLPLADIKAVRGELTKETLGLSNDTVLGDLGLLSRRLLPNVIKKKYAIGIIPHYVDKGHPWVLEAMKALGKSGLLIDVRNSAKQVTKLISQCELIYSSSLHGVIVSDALGIPNAWIELSDKVFGGGFKFKDYASSIDFDIEPVILTPDISITTLDKRIKLKNEIKIHRVIDNLTTVFEETLNSFSSSDN